MSVLGRLKDGEMKLVGEVSERLPSILSGLVCHYPFDGTCLDVINGTSPTQNPDTNQNILTNLSTEIMNPVNWTGALLKVSEDGSLTSTDGGASVVFSQFIPVDVTRHYFISADVKKVSGGGTTYLGCISYDVNLNVVAGHPGSYDYFGIVGEAIPADGIWRSRCNSAIGGAPRTGTSSDTNLATFDPNTKYIRILTISNYFGSGETRWKNFKLYYTDSDSSNTTKTWDGICVDEATTNLLAPQGYTNLLGATMHSGQQISTRDTSVKLYSEDSLKIVCTGADGAENRGAYCYVSGLVVGYTYTYSVHIYPTSIVTFGYIGRNNPWTPTKDQLGKWNRVFFTFVAESSSANLIYFALTTSGTTTFYLADAQIENKDFPTAFTKTSRGSSALSILNPVKTGEYTISFKCKINPYVGNVVNCYSTIMSMGSYYTPNSWTIMDQSNPSIAGIFTLIRKGNAGEWDWQGGNMSSPSTFNSFNTYTIVRDALYYHCYYNGILTGSTYHCSTTMQDLIWIGSKENGINASSSIIKDLSIYNRAFSSDEVLKLVNNKMSLKSNGNIPSVILSERPAIPPDCYYFPLTMNAKDQYGLISPASEVNISFTKDGAWIGTTTTNRYQGWGASAINGAYSIDVTRTAEQGCISGSTTHKLVKTGSANQWNGWEQGYGVGLTTAGQYLTASHYYKTRDNIGSISPLNFYTQDWSRVCGTATANNVAMKTDGKWNFAYATAVLTESITDPILADALSWNYSTSAGTMYVCGQMWEQKSFPSPWCPNGTSRGMGNLTYNLNRDIGLDWNGDWTVCYWKKPLSTWDDTPNSYSIESIGCNSNSVGGGYLWWGKQNGVNTVGGVGTGFKAFSTYFNKWHMISVTKTGAVITFKHWGIDGTILTEATNVGVISSNNFVTQYGRDLTLAGCDGGYGNNSYYKDLVVAKRALTDGELNSIYSTQMRAYNGNSKLLIRSGINEGSQL